MKRATEGFREPVFYQGKLCGWVRRFDGGLAQFLLRGAMPEKYGTKTQVSGEIDIGMKKFTGTLEDLLATYRELTAKGEQP